MKLVIQRVKEAKVTVEGKTVGEIYKGLLVFVGIAPEDTKETADRYLKKLVDFRIFEDEKGKTNLSLLDVGGELLLVSQFTLYANCKKGNRPSFIEAASPDLAEPLYEYMLEKAKEYVDMVEGGVIGGHMQVSLVNDGPFTIVLDQL